MCYSVFMDDINPRRATKLTHRLSDAEIAEIRRRRPGVRASFACEAIQFTAEDEALFEQMDRERLTADERAQRIIEISRAKRRQKLLAST
jgi:hypothetical protein